MKVWGDPGLRELSRGCVELRLRPLKGTLAHAGISERYNVAGSGNLNKRKTWKCAMLLPRDAIVMTI